MSQWKDPVGRAAIVLVAAICVAVAGCASEPQLTLTSANSLPARGDSLEDLARRGWRFVPVYEFIIDGRRYAFAYAVSVDTSYDLVFIDSTLACTAQQGLDRDLMEWQWAGEPEGLAYLAGRLRQACDLEPRTPPRTTYAVESPDPMKVKVAPAASSPGEESFGEVVVGGLVGSVLLTAALVWGPLLWIPAGIYEWATAPPEATAEATAPIGRDPRALLLRVPMPVEEVTARLGAPQASFMLPQVGTEVQQYRVEKQPLLYVGVTDGQVVWIHGPDAWLRELAKQAKAAQSQSK